MRWLGALRLGSVGDMGDSLTALDLGDGRTAIEVAGGMETHMRLALRRPMLSVNSPALILSKHSGVFLAKIG